MTSLEKLESMKSLPGAPRVSNRKFRSPIRRGWNLSDGERQRRRERMEKWHAEQRAAGIRRGNGRQYTP